MPYKSEAQRKWAHSPKGMKALGGKKKVEEWDRASKGKKLPPRVKKTGTKKEKLMLHQKLARGKKIK